MHELAARVQARLPPGRTPDRGQRGADAGTRTPGEPRHSGDAMPGSGPSKARSEQFHMQVGFIGLGRMGSAIAHRLIAAGHQVTVYNRTRSRAEALREAGAVVADTPADA